MCLRRNQASRYRRAVDKGGDAADAFGRGFGEAPYADPVRGNLRNIPSLPDNKLTKKPTKKGYRLPGAALSAGDALVCPTGPGKRGLKRVFVGISWKGSFNERPVDLDLTVAPFSWGERSVEDTVFYGKTASKPMKDHNTNKTGKFFSAIKHTGDELQGSTSVDRHIKPIRGTTGEPDLERIYVDLERLPTKYDAIAFEANIFTNECTFRDLESVTVRLVNADTNQEIASMSHDTHKFGQASASEEQMSSRVFLLAKMFRRPDDRAWLLHASQEPRLVPIIEMPKSVYHGDMVYYKPLHGGWKSPAQVGSATATPRNSVSAESAGAVRLPSGAAPGNQSMERHPTDNKDIIVESKFDAPDTARSTSKRREREYRESRRNWRKLKTQHHGPAYMAPNMSMAYAAAIVAALQVFEMPGPDPPANGGSCVQRDKLTSPAFDADGLLMAPTLPTDCGCCSELDCCGQNCGLLCGKPYDCICAGGLCHTLGMTVPVNFPCCCCWCWGVDQGDVSDAAKPFHPVSDCGMKYGDGCLENVDWITSWEYCFCAYFGCTCGPAPGVHIPEESDEVGCCDALGDFFCNLGDCCFYLGTAAQDPCACFNGCACTCCGCCDDLGLCCGALTECLCCDHNPKRLNAMKNPDDESGFKWECTGCVADSVVGCCCAITCLDIYNAACCVDGSCGCDCGCDACGNDDGKRH